MVSRENQVIVAFGVLAIVLLYVLATLTDLPTWAIVAIVIVVGVIVPQLVNGSVNE